MDNKKTLPTYEQFLNREPLRGFPYGLTRFACLDLYKNPYPQPRSWKPIAEYDPQVSGGSRHGEAGMADSPEGANPAASLVRLQRIMLWP